MAHVPLSPVATGQMTEPSTTNTLIANGEDHEARIAALAAGSGGGGGGTTTITPGFDIFILAGQSNMAGAGYTGMDTVHFEPSDNRVLQWGAVNYPNEVTVATSPYDHPDWVLGPGTKGIGPGEGFAQWYSMYMQPGRKILFVPTAYGGTGFEANDAHSLNRYWKVSTPVGYDPLGTGRLDLYRQSVEHAKAALAGSPPGSAIVGVLWHQGEQDGGTTAASVYQTDLDALIAAYRSDLGIPNLPFVCGQMTYETRTMDSNHAAIDAVHIATGIRNQYAACAFGPLAGYTDATNGTVHYSAAGQRLQGRAYYEAYLASLTNITGAAPLAPGSPTITQLTSTSVRVNWIPLGGRVSDYTTQYTVNGGTTWSTVTHTATTLPYITITGLTAGATVQARVAQVNGSGTSSYVTTSPLTLQSTPGQVVGVTVGTPASTTMPLSWTATSGATAYSVDYSTNGGTSWTNFSTSIVGNSTTVTGLTASTSYVFRISASNAWGTGTASATTSAVSTAAPGTAAFSDTFNRTASTTGANWTAPIGGATFPTNGSICGIANSSTTAVTTYLNIVTLAAYTASDHTNVFAQMDVAAMSGNTSSGNTPLSPTIVLNYADVNNYYTASFTHATEPSTTGTWGISKNLAGTTTTLATSSSVTMPSFPYTMKLTKTESGGVATLTLYVNGTSVLSITDSSPLEGTQAGFKIRAGGASGVAALNEQQQVDNFSCGQAV